MMIRLVVVIPLVQVAEPFGMRTVSPCVAASTADCTSARDAELASTSLPDTEPETLTAATLPNDRDNNIT